jgi:hypothetical protein
MWSFLKHYDGAQPGKRKTSFKNVWWTWGPALPTLLADLMIFCPLGPIGPTNFKNSDTVLGKYISSLSDTVEQVDKPYRPTQKLYFLYSGREQLQ